MVDLRDKNLKKLCSGISKELSALNSVIDFSQECNKMFGVETKIRIGPESGNIHIFFDLS